MLRIGAASSSIVAIVRDGDATVERLCAIGRALLRNGLTVIEFPMTNPGAPEVVATLVPEHPEAAIGVGTVLDTGTLELARGAGAAFAVTPTVDDRVLTRAREIGMPMIAGALSPTEIVRAHRLGAIAVKIFPAGQLGPSYLSALRAPLPDIPFVPTGGITVGDAYRYLEAGAVAVGLGGDLIGDGSDAHIRDRMAVIRGTIADGEVSE